MIIYLLYLCDKILKSHYKIETKILVDKNYKIK